MCGSKDDAKLNESDHTFVIRKNKGLKHRCPLQCFMRIQYPINRGCKTHLLGTTESLFTSLEGRRLF